MKQAITVGELIEVLKTFDPSLPAWTEGCDCWGECNGASLQEQYKGREPFNLVLLERSE